MGELNEMQTESVNEIHSNLIHLANQIEHLLTAFKLGASSLTFSDEQINTGKILKAVIKEQGPLMLQKNTEFVDTSTDEFTVSGDSRRIKEIFTNLVQNSVDFVPDTDGKISIEGASQDKHVQFFIKDNGIGMPEQVKLKVFEPFFTTKEQGKGTDLGLSTCYRIMK